MTTDRWKAELLTQRIREANSVKWPDGTYGPPTEGISALLRTAIYHLETSDLDGCERLLAEIEVATLANRRGQIRRRA
jgi:hypothetical protein